MRAHPLKHVWYKIKCLIAPNCYIYRLKISFYLLYNGNTFNFCFSFFGNKFSNRFQLAIVCSNQFTFFVSVDDFGCSFGSEAARGWVSSAIDRTPLAVFTDDDEDFGGGVNDRLNDSLADVVRIRSGIGISSSSESISFSESDSEPPVRFGWWVVWRCWWRKKKPNEFSNSTLSINICSTYQCRRFRNVTVKLFVGRRRIILFRPCFRQSTNNLCQINKRIPAKCHTKTHI